MQLARRELRVKAHCDPYRVVAMVRLGATRTFEVGEQRRNGGNNFKPYPMPHGSLITFLSGGLAHRMLPDPAAGDCVSLVFRLVTPPQTVASWHDKPTYSRTRAAHRKLYDAAVSEYRAALTFRWGCEMTLEDALRLLMPEGELGDAVHAGILACAREMPRVRII